MFIRCGYCHFPDIPFLTVNDVWLGGAFDDGSISDQGKLLMEVSRGIWGRNLIIVTTGNWCYSFYSDDPDLPAPKRFSPRTLNPVIQSEGLTRWDTIDWTSPNGELLHRGEDGEWYIDSPLYGQGNRYEIGWGGDYAIANPIGPWLDDDPPPISFRLDIDWPRWQNSRAYGTQNAAGLYVPATTYVKNQVTGEIQTGVPTWELTYQSETIRIYKTVEGYKDPHSGKGAYHLVSDIGGESGYLGWVEENDRYELWGSRRAWAPEPTIGSSWRITMTPTTGGTVVEDAQWIGYTNGDMRQKRQMCEIARLL